ncbi:MAG: class I SAM-dependent methyltransferase [Deltaproteobacteria bacterium]|nr:class I SAM-dependent methyltransferase [Deltaproteobacteria bacterium]
MRLAVTTVGVVDTIHDERAALLAARFSVPLLPRRRPQELVSNDDVDVFYVVRNSHEELRTTGESALVQPGMMPTKLQQGEQHPFVRAVRGETAGRRDDVKSIFDATLGLANDAVHLAAVTGARVIGCEQSPVLFSLLEEGLPRIARGSPRTMRWADAAGRVSVVQGESAEILAGMADDAVDVVVLDPMMSVQKRSAPSFSLLRAFAVMDRAQPRLLLQARRVARLRVVFKLGKGAPLPVNRSIEFPRRTTGAHVVYWVHEKSEDAVFAEVE